MLFWILVIIALLVGWYGFAWEGFDPDDSVRYVWSNCPGLLKQVRVTDTEVWGINRAGSLYYRPIRGDQTWKRLHNKPPLNLQQITASKDFIFGVDDQQFIKGATNPVAIPSYLMISTVRRSKSILIVIMYMR